MQELSEQPHELQDKGVKDKILATSSEMPKVENTPAEMLCDMDQQWKGGQILKQNVVTNALSMKERVKPRRVRAMAMTIQYGERGMIRATQSEAFKQENAQTKIDKTRWNTSWISCDAKGGRLGKGVVHIRKKGKTEPRGLSGAHDTFHVSNLKKCLADASLHVPLDEIRVDKALHFVEEPVEIMDQEVRSLKRSRISLVKVRWNSKRCSEFNWEREDHMKSKYP
ncbi:hypothetical protein Tco_0361277 [Tanacetum coccineum]